MLDLLRELVVIFHLRKEWALFVMVVILHWNAIELLVWMKIPYHALLLLVIIALDTVKVGRICFWRTRVVGRLGLGQVVYLSSCMVLARPGLPERQLVMLGWPGVNSAAGEYQYWDGQITLACKDIRVAMVASIAN